MSEAEDVALPFDIHQCEPSTNTHEENDMPILSIGAPVRVPELAGRWSVWSQTSETPGGYFIVPADDVARAIGAKYAVIRAKTFRGSPEPKLTLLRTDPHIPGLVDQ